MQGSVVIRERTRIVVKHREDGTPVERERLQLQVLYCDVIAQSFWDEHPHVLS